MTRESATISCHFRINALRGIFRYRVQDRLGAQPAATFTFRLCYAVAFHLVTLHRQPSALYCLFEGEREKKRETRSRPDPVLARRDRVRRIDSRSAETGLRVRFSFSPRSCHRRGSKPTSFRSLFRIPFLSSPPFISATDPFPRPSRYLPFTTATSSTPSSLFSTFLWPESMLPTFTRTSRPSH